MTVLTKLTKTSYIVCCNYLFALVNEFIRRKRGRRAGPIKCGLRRLNPVNSQVNSNISE